MIDVEAMLLPISVQQPCGEDLAFSPDFDAIAAARRQDDPTLAQGEWSSALHDADWRQVAQRCGELLRTRSKDLRLAAWLTEALAQDGGLRGLGQGLALLAALCERYWDELHPLAEQGDMELRAGNLAWLLARLPMLLRRMTPAAEGGADAVEREAVQHCLDALAALQAVAERRLGGEGPSFAAAREALLALAPPPAPPPVAAAPGRPAARPESQGYTRAQALAQLRAVAAYFRQAEPHSPVAYLAERAAAWGEMPLHDWLRAVVKDSAQIAQLDELLGVPPKEVR